MFCLKLVSALLLLFSISYSAINENYITFIEGQGIDLSQSTTITLSSSCIGLNCPVDSTVYKRADIDLAYFPTSLWDDFLCGCGGVIYSLLSKDTMWYVKKTIDFNTNTPLKLSDTSQFESLANPDNGYLSQAQCPYFQNPCPSYCGEWTQPLSHWFIGRTKESKYFMFRFVDNKTIYDSLTGSTHEQTKIHCLLQNDGTLDFVGAKITSVLHKNKTYNRSSDNKNRLFLITGGRSKKTPSGVIYNLQGRKLDIPSGAMECKNIPRLIISSQ